MPSTIGDQNPRSCAPCVAANYGNQITRYKSNPKIYDKVTGLNAYYPPETRNPNIPEGSLLIFKMGAWRPLITPKVVKNSVYLLPLMFDTRTKTICVVNNA